MVHMRIIRFMTRWQHTLARRTENLATLTVLNGFGLSHILGALSHAGATVGHPCDLLCAPYNGNNIDCCMDEVKLVRQPLTLFLIES